MTGEGSPDDALRRVLDAGARRLASCPTVQVPLTVLEAAVGALEDRLDRLEALADRLESMLDGVSARRRPEGGDEAAGVS